ncbi:MAG: DEAD/DEAH box helicase, partial [Selenomonadaceae bacterium]|nr:DEAD/DEAH box helicase [Selenomonadaceae bacterium]
GSTRRDQTGFEALFENYSFVNNNAVSKSMQKIFSLLDTEDDNEHMKKFSESVRQRCEIATTADQRQKIIIELYDKFFKTALPLTVERLGIVYTPVEVVDFILQSVNDVLKKNFNRTLSNKKVHILDPFTGTGTFITRLIQSGLIQQKDLLRKYQNELHANEIILLAYYIAAINIENTFHDALGLKDFFPFDGICFTDTFQTFEDDDKNQAQTSLENFKDPLQENSERVKEQIDTEIKIIIGNPPYSVGQKSANDNAQNNFYPKIEERISLTYAAGTNATNKNSLYDSYIKAFRWASDRIGDSGVIGFVTNAGWIDGAAMDGMRNCFVKEFSEVYVFNLRGNQRTQGEMSRREGGKIFGSGSRAPIAITILVKNPAHIGDAEIFYLDIGDYLSRDEKLSRIQAVRTVLSDEFKIITPNDKGDWINQRGNDFENFIPLAPAKKFDATAQSFFSTYSCGLQTNRDAWVYNFSHSELEKNIQLTIDYYNTHTPLDVDPTKITWASSTVSYKNRGQKIIFDSAKIFHGIYRPFCKENVYYDEYLNHRRYQLPKIFPTGNEENFLICVPGIGDSKNFSAFIVNKICDLGIEGASQCFPLYWYEAAAQGNLFGDSYERRDGVTEFILGRAKILYGLDVTREDIFYYVYGFLHLPAYREKFSAELKKSLPRIFLVEDAKKFWALVKAGRELAEIHLHYEEQEPPAQVEVVGGGNYRVKKLRFAKDDRTTLIYNEYITIKNIPLKSFEYVVNGRSPLEWIMDRYQVKVDSASGIENNPNDWCDEHGDEKYILNLILSCITVSMKTLEIVENLPAVEF